MKIPIGKDLQYGIEAAFQEINNQGGVHNNLLNLRAFDDKNEDSLAKKNIEQVFSQKTGGANNIDPEESILLSPYHTNFLNYLPHEIASKLMVLFPTIASNKLKDEYPCKIISFRPTVAQEVKALIDYAIKSLTAKRIVIFCEEGEWSEEAVEFAKKYLQNLPGQKLNLVASAYYPKNSLNIKKAIDKISNLPTELSPDTIICISHPRATYRFVADMIENKFRCNFLSTSHGSFAQAFISKSLGVSITTSSVVPNPWQSQLPIVKAYRAAMNKYKPNYHISFLSLEGYIIASLLIEALKEKRKTNLLKSITQITGINGLNLKWDGSSLSQKIWIHTKTPIY